MKKKNALRTFCVYGAGAILTIGAVLLVVCLVGVFTKKSSFDYKWSLEPYDEGIALQLSIKEYPKSIEWFPSIFPSSLNKEMVPDSSEWNIEFGPGRYGCYNEETGKTEFYSGSLPPNYCQQINHRN